MSLTPLTLETGPIRRRQWNKRRDPWEEIRNDDAATSSILFDLVNWILIYITGEGPSVFTKSPIEHTIEKKSAWNAIPYQMRKIKQHATQGRPIPDGHVRVRLYNSIKDLTRTEPLLTAVVALEPCGALDIRRIKSMWGLESCSIVDPFRFRLFVPENDDLIAPLAVHDLRQHYNAINIIEPNVSPTTARRRDLRLNILRPISIFISHQQDRSITWLRKNTKLVDWAEETERDLQGSLRFAARRLEGWAAENHPDLLWLWESVNLSWLVTLGVLFLLWKFDMTSM